MRDLQLTEMEVSFAGKAQARLHEDPLDLGFCGEAGDVIDLLLVYPALSAILKYLRHDGLWRFRSSASGEALAWTEKVELFDFHVFPATSTCRLPLLSFPVKHRTCPAFAVICLRRAFLANLNDPSSSLPDLTLPERPRI